MLHISMILTFMLIAHLTTNFAVGSIFSLHPPWKVNYNEDTDFSIYYQQLIIFEGMPYEKFINRALTD